MARRAGALIWPGAAVAAALCLLTLGTLTAVLARADAASLTAADWSAVRFTVLQAAVSALLSVGLAVPVARALARRRFAGRGLLISLMGAPFLLPVIAAILGLLAVFGRQGLLNGTLQALGLAPVSIYGFHGVVLAHVFFNLPLAVRMILSGWQGIPAERFRLAAALGLGPGAVFRHLEWPMLRAIHQVIERLGLFGEHLQGAVVDDSTALYQHPASYYQRAELLPALKSNETLRERFFGGVEKPVFTTSSADTGHKSRCRLRSAR